MVFETAITLAAIQALGAAVHGTINAYLSAPPKPSFQAASGLETLYDEDNWARVLDTHAVLFLVRPFLESIQKINVTELEAATRTASTDTGRRLGSHQDGSKDEPPTYDEAMMKPQDWISRRAYEIVRNSQRLIEVLTTASAGPSGSSPRAWNLHVNASVETAIELLEKYKCVVEKLAEVPPASYLGLLKIKLDLQDEELYATAVRTFSAVQVETSTEVRCGHKIHFYTLRSPSQQRFLSFEPSDDTLPHRTAWGRAGKAALWTTTIVGSGIIGGAVLGGIEYWRHSNKVSAAKAVGQLCMAAQGQGCTSISFITAGPQLGVSEKHGPASSQGEVLQFDMLVHLAVDTKDASHSTVMLPRSDGSGQVAAFRIVHCDERYRSQGSCRVVTARDRILLKEEDTGKLLGRTKLSDNEWSVGCGGSDDTMWTISVPL